MSMQYAFYETQIANRYLGVEQSVSKYSRGVCAADGSGPPPWVPFGKRIVKNETEMQKFKSLKDPEGKEKIDGEFENQRKQAVKELSKEGNLKVMHTMSHYLIYVLQCNRCRFYSDFYQQRCKDHINRPYVYTVEPRYMSLIPSRSLNLYQKGCIPNEFFP